jgi:hypothetical protein
LRHSNFIVACCLVLLAGCGGKSGSQQPVARLDGQTLTLDEVIARLDSTRGMTQAQVAEYARRWVNDEMLYREAVRRGLHDDETIRTQLEQTRRQLAINALLQQEVFTPRSLDAAPEEISQYYASHLKEFTLSTDVGLLSYVMFRDRDAANAFRANVLRGTPWSEALRQTLADPQAASAFVGRIDSAYYTSSTLLPVELWRVAAAATKPEPSFPVHINDGFYILSLWKMTRQGQVADRDYVEHEIRTRLAVERRRNAYNALVENLRSKHTVEVLVSGESDTSSTNSVR